MEYNTVQFYKFMKYNIDSLIDGSQPFFCSYYYPVFQVPLQKSTFTLFSIQNFRANKKKKVFSSKNLHHSQTKKLASFFS